MEIQAKNGGEQLRRECRSPEKLTQDQKLGAVL